MAGTGVGVPGGDCAGAACGGAAGLGLTAGGAGGAAGDAAAPGCVPGGAGGGFSAAAGCPRPATGGGFGVPLGVGDADGVADGADAPVGAAETCASVGAIGPAGSSFFFAKSASVNSMACSIEIRATPLFLSIQP
ncbi:MAG: hypothetical protein DMF46_03090 [Verrucomicrobia bacterium]|nr:MAG: hypothetical protein DMF46_03090 [Verrucomicrobiota bacterium]